MARKHSALNFIGIERYSSVLLRAIEKFDTEEFQELENVRFVCMDARNVEEVFAPKGAGKDLSEFFRSHEPESTTCEETAYFSGISGAL